MKMYKEIKNIYECSCCGSHFRRNEVIISYKEEYLCSRCYERTIDDKKTQNPLNSWKSWEEEMTERFPQFSSKHREIMPERSIDEELEEEDRKKEEIKEKKVLSPKEIVEYLNKNMIGQEEAKKTLAVAVHNHYRRVFANTNQPKIPKSNILMQGSTGSGKTYLLKNLAKILDVPLFIADTSTITEVGYKGNNPESVLTGLYQAADGDISKAEKGIVYLDEFDKLSIHYGHSAGGSNSSVGAGVQRQILKMLEGCEMAIPTGQKNPEKVSINTENILFICGGAFVGIKKEKTSKKTGKIGFSYMEEAKEHKGPEPKERKLTTEDFVDFGLIPEIVGRLPVIVSLHDLSERDICNILTDSGESVLKSYEALLKEYGVKLIFTPEAIAEIAHQTTLRKTGARGINALVENVMRDLMYEIPSDDTICKCVITTGAIRGEESPLIEHKSMAEELLQKAS